MNWGSSQLLLLLLQEQSVYPGCWSWGSFGKASGDMILPQPLSCELSQNSPAWKLLYFNYKTCLNLTRRCVCIVIQVSNFCLSLYCYGYLYPPLLWGKLLMMICAAIIGMVQVGAVTALELEICLNRGGGCTWRSEHFKVKSVVRDTCWGYCRATCSSLAEMMSPAAGEAATESLQFAGGSCAAKGRLSCRGTGQQLQM